MKRFWQFVSFSFTAVMVVLCLLQLVGWFVVPRDVSAVFALAVLAASAGAGAVSEVLSRKGLPWWLDAVLAAACGFLVSLGLVRWWAGLEPSAGLILSLLLAAACAVLAVAGMTKLLASALADSINREIAARDREKRGGESEEKKRRD